MTVAVTALAAAALTAGAVAYRELATSPSPTADRSVPIASAPTVSEGRGFAFTEDKGRKPLPKLRFVDGDGREMNFDAFAGRVVLLNIWATWCVPCREEMPALDRLQAKLGGPAFEVVALSIDREGLPVVKAFYEELGLQALGIYVDRTGAAGRHLRVVGIPTTLLVDRRGREIGRTVGPAEWDSDEVVQVIRRHLGDGAAEAGVRAMR
ncbi:MAG: TlpA disulfide reductase family protein [Alphaproteobacteria bacterium]